MNATCHDINNNERREEKKITKQKMKSETLVGKNRNQKPEQKQQQREAKKKLKNFEEKWRIRTHAVLHEAYNNRYNRHFLNEKKKKSLCVENYLGRCFGIYVSWWRKCVLKPKRKSKSVWWMKMNEKK